MASELIRRDLGWLFMYQMYLTRVSGVGRSEAVNIEKLTPTQTIIHRAAFGLGAAIDYDLAALQQPCSQSTLN